MKLGLWYHNVTLYLSCSMIIDNDDNNDLNRFSPK